MESCQNRGGHEGHQHHIGPFVASFRFDSSIGFQEVELKAERFRVCEALFEPAHCHLVNQRVG